MPADFYKSPLAKTRLAYKISLFTDECLFEGLRFMENKMNQNKNDKESTQNTNAGEKTVPAAETVRPLSKRRSRRRLPAW